MSRGRAMGTRQSCGGNVEEPRNGGPVLDSLVRKESVKMLAPVPPSYVICSICHKPVTLETTKVDEYGQAVHEECYIPKIISPR